MKTIITLALATALMTTAPAFADTLASGEIVKVDAKRNKLTIKHGPIESLNMDAMTMVYDVAEPTMVDGLAPGKAVSFHAERVKGKLTVTEIE